MTWFRLAVLPAVTCLLTSACDPAEGPELRVICDCEPAPDGGAPDAQADDDPEPAGPPILEPSSGSMSGYFRVAIDFGPTGVDPTDIERLTLGGLATILSETDGDVVSTMVQGRAVPGPAELLVHTADGRIISFPNAFSYDPPRYPTIGHIAAVGASVSQGVQSGAPSAEGSIGAPPALVARQAGAYMPLPLLRSDLFPSYTAEHVGPPPLCATPDVVEWLTGAVAQMVPKVTDERGRTWAALGRLDPTVTPSNLAVGGSVVSDLLYGPMWPGAIMMSRFVYAPEGQVFAPPAEAPIDLVARLNADVILALDFYGNDTLLQDPAESTDAEERLRTDLVRDIESTVDALAGTGATVFVGDIPMTSLMYETALLRVQVLAEADDPEAAGLAYDADVAIVDERTRIANATLVDAAARYANVHVLPTAATVESLTRQPYPIGGRILTTGMFGGLVGLDGLHFTDTGNALLANLVITKMNEVMGVEIPLVNLEAVMATDPETADAMRAQGVPVDECILR